MSIYIFLSTVIKVLSLLLLPALVVGQCANPMPSGACCEADGFFTEADPEVPLQGSLFVGMFNYRCDLTLQEDSRKIT